jgi:hypothetical protein
VGLLSFIRGRRGPALEGYDEVSGDDREVLKAMVLGGAELKDPRHVLHYVYVPDETRARDAQAKLVEAGWAVEVRAPEGPAPGWLVLSQRHGYVLTPAAVVADRLQFDAIAERLGGEYDGWEASLA